MSPEQYKNEIVSFPTDIWAMGGNVSELGGAIPIWGIETSYAEVTAEVLTKTRQT